MPTWNAGGINETMLNQRETRWQQVIILNRG